LASTRSNNRRRSRRGPTAGATAPPHLDALEPRLLLAANVVINELHVDPPIATEMAEYVELHNAGDTGTDVSGWYFDAGIDFIIPEGTTIAPGGFRSQSRSARW